MKMTDKATDIDWMARALRRAVDPNPGATVPARRVSSMVALQKLFDQTLVTNAFETYWPIAAASGDAIAERTKPGVFRLTHVVGETLGEHAILLEFNDSKAPQSEAVTLLCESENGQTCRIQLAQFDALTYQTALAPDDSRAEILGDPATRITILCN